MAVSTALTGCGGTQPAENTTAAQSTQQQEVKLDADQTLRIVGVDPKSFDPSAKCDQDTFRTGDGNNSSFYANKQFDDLVNGADKELDSAKRIDAYKQAEQILCVDDPGVVTAYYSDFQTFRYKYLKGLVQPLFGGLYTFQDAYIQGRE